MAFPFISEANFELGTLGHFDAESDTDGKLDFPSFAELARFNGLPAPYRGACCMRADLAGGSNDAYVQETAAWDMTAGTNDIYLRFMLWIDPLISMANTDEFGILQFWSGTNTVEGEISLNYTTANGLRLGMGETGATVFHPIMTNRWNAIEVFFDPAGGGAGTIDAWLNGDSLTQVGSLTHANITSGVLGVLDFSGASGTTGGILLFDDVIADDARIYPPTLRFPEQFILTAAGHAFVGPGRIGRLELLSGNGTDNVVTVYDTDSGTVTDATNVKAEIRNVTAYETVPLEGPIDVQRGAYINLAGTDPRCRVTIERAVAYGSDGAIRTYGARRV
jgi:hypothetical protein